jgi:hypothetical protein
MPLALKMLKAEIALKNFCGILGRFWVVFGSILGDSGDHLGMIWACSGEVPGFF